MNPRTVWTSDELAELRKRSTLSWREAAALVGVGPSALRDAVRRGEIKLPVISVGTRKVIPTAAIRRLLEDVAS